MALGRESIFIHLLDVTEREMLGVGIVVQLQQAGECGSHATSIFTPTSPTRRIWPGARVGQVRQPANPAHFWLDRSERVLH